MAITVDDIIFFRYINIQMVKNPFCNGDNYMGKNNAEIKSDHPSWNYIHDSIKETVSSFYAEGSELNIVVCESGSAFTELHIILDLVQAGYSIGTVVLMDRQYERDRNYKYLENLNRFLGALRHFDCIKNYVLLDSYEALYGYMKKNPVSLIFSVHPNTNTPYGKQLKAALQQNHGKFFQGRIAPPITTFLTTGFKTTSQNALLQRKTGKKNKIIQF